MKHIFKKIIPIAIVSSLILLTTSSVAFATAGRIRQGTQKTLNGHANSGNQASGGQSTGHSSRSGGGSGNYTQVPNYNAIYNISLNRGTFNYLANSMLSGKFSINSWAYEDYWTSPTVYVPGPNGTWVKQRMQVDNSINVTVSKTSHTTKTNKLVGYKWVFTNLSWPTHGHADAQTSAPDYSGYFQAGQWQAVKYPIYKTTTVVTDTVTASGYVNFTGGYTPSLSKSKVMSNTTSAAWVDKSQPEYFFFFLQNPGRIDIANAHQNGNNGGGGRGNGSGGGGGSGGSNGTPSVTWSLVQ